MTAEDKQELRDQMFYDFGFTSFSESDIAKFEVIIMKSKIKKINSLRLTKEEVDKKSPLYAYGYTDALNKVLELLNSDFKPEPDCLHAWVDITNKVISGTMMCSKCMEFAPLPKDQDTPKPKKSKFQQRLDDAMNKSKKP